MRYCPYCRRWNAGRPQLCNYCGRSWHVRLCRRGHANPYDAEYCGACGSADLTDTAGPRPLWIWLVRAAALALFIFLVVLLSRGRLYLSDLTIAYVLAIGLLLAGLYLTLSILPGPLKKLLLAINRIVKRILLGAFKWCWEKLKQVFE